MSVQMQQFRVVGVSNTTGEDVSVVIDAATKAAAEVKAEQMDIETTHIVRLKQEEPSPPDEHELFSSEAAEALAGKRTDKLIEEVVPPEEPKPAAPSHTAASPTTAQPNAGKPPTVEEHKVLDAITRPNYAAAGNRRDSALPAHASGMRAFGFVLLVLLLMTAGAYYVLIHEPNAVQAEHNELVFGEDLFSDVLAPDAAELRANQLRDAFGNTAGTTNNTTRPPIDESNQIRITSATPTKPASTSASDQAPDAPKLELQSVVTSHEGRFAVINGKFYKQGADVQGAKLVSVADDWVLMEKAGQQFTLQIEAESKP